MACHVEEEGKYYGLHFPMFTVIVSVNGEKDTVYEGGDRNTAIAFAIAKAVQIHNEWIPNDVEYGFEHDGQWITDRTKSALWSV